MFVEYAKESPEDILIQISVHNRGPEAAELHVLPTLWFRNRWSWGGDNPAADRCSDVAGEQSRVVQATDAELGERYLYCDGERAAAVHGKRNQCAAAVRRRRTGRRSSRTASTTSSSTDRRTP